MELTTTELPVELASFEAVLSGSDVLLRWETASETNNAGFDIEHRKANGSFEPIAFVEGHDTTLEARQYSYGVTDLEPGQHTFRLKQVDFDGSFEFSPEVEVHVGMIHRFVLEPAFPNRSNGPPRRGSLLAALVEMTPL